MKAWRKSIGLIITWLVVFGIFSILQPDSFPTFRNLETIFRQTVITGFAVIGMTFIIIIGAIDLSLGSLIALVTVVVAILLRQGQSPAVAALAGVAVGGLAGLTNGLVMTNPKVGSFIVTLVTQLAFRGVAKGLTDAKSVPTSINWLTQFTSALPPDRKWMLLPIGGWCVVLFSVLGATLLNRMVFGRHVFAIGANAESARFAGINVSRTQVLVFLFAGLCFGLAGVMQYSRLSVGDPTGAQGLELSVIAAVVIGGASLNGGEGSISGSLLGALVMTTIATGASQLGWPNWVQEIVTGGIILSAVGLDRWRMRRQAT